MKTNYTPAPWRVNFDEAIKIADDNNSTLAMVTHLHLLGRRNGNEVEANARLIAAAPELLEALEELANRAAEIHGTARHTVMPLVHKARAAIAKATGGQS